MIYTAVNSKCEVDIGQESSIFQLGGIYVLVVKVSD